MTERQSDKDNTVYLCCATGEGSHEFKVVATEMEVMEWAESMFGGFTGEHLNDSLEHFRDPDEWSNSGMAYEVALYCAKMYVWRVSPKELSLPGAAVPDIGTIAPTSHGSAAVTPRTDAKVRPHGSPFACVDADFARKLERELAEAVQDAAAVRVLMNSYNLGGWTDAEGPMKRALQAEAQLADAKDTIATWRLAETARSTSGHSTVAHMSEVDLDSLLRDACRYRWLRDIRPEARPNVYMDALDERIDKVRSARQERQS